MNLNKSGHQDDAKSREGKPTSTFTPASALAFNCCSVAVTVPVAPCRFAWDWDWDWDWGEEPWRGVGEEGFGFGFGSGSGSAGVMEEVDFRGGIFFSFLWGCLF